MTYPAYTRSLTSILSETETDVLEAYLVSRAALVLAPRLGPSTASWKAVRNLREVLQGIKPGAVGDRAEYCIDSVDQALGFAAGRYFVNEAFAGDSKEKGTKVITGALRIHPFAGFEFILHRYCEGLQEVSTDYILDG